MKTEINQKKVFKPVELKLTFETEREFKLFAQAIGSYSFKQHIDMANSCNQEDYSNFTIDNDFDLSKDKDIFLAIYLETTKINL